jgi:hypothetical protein
MILTMMLAAFGIGITNALGSYRGRYMDNEIKTEKVAKKENEGNEEESRT